ncbi:hypothetical protein AXFE_01810 [Acidithrix ferrooxidans]|uniref:Uncharacterized protein n=1 Tax=Acidithrix ferrooxidans TaxID=1280514 RepID=A0A0D8HLN5_9ACTN|nr:hypothetical protein AXFE_01810 [Acidithrix ferrooxidans]
MPRFSGADQVDLSGLSVGREKALAEIPNLRRKLSGSGSI